MGKQYVNQHIVPKRYLERFASVVDGKYIIGTRCYVKNGPRFFKESISNVGYIKNYYDVTDKDDSKYWEHYLAREIDTLCGRDMQSVIASITLSTSNAIVLSEQSKRVLSKVIVAQMMRVPSSVEYVNKLYPRVEKTVKEDILAAMPESLLAKYKPIVQELSFNDQWKKEQYFNHSFSPENFGRYCDLMFDRGWVVYVNAQRTLMPFVTSDNPVLVEGIGKTGIGLFHNGLANPSTCIFYPISPAIAVANYSKYGIMKSVADELDGKKFLLNDVKFVMDKNMKIMGQAYHHSFIPQPLYDMIVTDDL